MATMGQPGKYTFCFGERNDGPFPTLTARRGLGADASAITVMGICGTAEVLPGGAGFKMTCLPVWGGGSETVTRAL